MSIFFIKKKKNQAYKPGLPPLSLKRAWTLLFWARHTGCLPFLFFFFLLKNSFIILSL